MDPLALPVRRLVNLAWYSLTEWADDKRKDALEQAIAAHEERLNREQLRRTGVPLWWNDDNEADAKAFMRGTPRR